jgi:hypothetical protein
MADNKLLRRPIIDPLLLVLKSRRVIIALSALLVGLLMLAVPDLQPVRGEILTLVVTLALALIGGYSVEDAARIARDRASVPPEQLRELIKDVLDGMVDEVSDRVLAQMDAKAQTKEWR